VKLTDRNSLAESLASVSPLQLLDGKSGDPARDDRPCDSYFAEHGDGRATQENGTSGHEVLHARCKLWVR
jgi:hypothetical protein